MRRLKNRIGLPTGLGLILSFSLAYAQEEIAGPALDHIRSWTTPNDVTLIVDTYDMRTYRLRVDEACDGLIDAERIGFSSDLARASDAPTSVLLDDGRECRVLSVARVEWKNRSDHELSGLKPTMGTGI